MQGQQNYGSSPLIQSSIPALSYNQTNSPSEQQLESLRMALKSKPSFVSCPFCGNQAITRTEQSCSVLSCLCCFCFGGIPWLVCQACKGKDINCTDANHSCERCGNNLAKYTSC